MNRPDEQAPAAIEVAIADPGTSGTRCSQLRLFPAPQPLVERLGAPFFRALPRAPGVYRMFDSAGELLYVGKAKDLRARLNSYRRTLGQSRKTVRLIHQVRRIEWEECPSEVEARLRENHLIRTLRPRFNRAGTWPASARYVRWRVAEGMIELAMVATLEETGFGVFRGGVGEALLALGRLAWLAAEPGRRPIHFPHPLVAAVRLRELRIPEQSWEGCGVEIRDFLGGANDRLVGRLVDRIAPPATPFEQVLVASQFEALQEFFRRGPVQNTTLKRVFSVDGPVLRPEERDDLLVRLSGVPEGQSVLSALLPPGEDSGEETH